jgi:hypothetical protein
MKNFFGSVFLYGSSQMFKNFLLIFLIGCGNSSGDTTSSSDQDPFAMPPDAMSPTIQDRIFFSDVKATGLTINWGVALDNATPAYDLQYKLVKDNISAANINTVEKADAKSGSDLLQDYVTGYAPKSISGLAPSTTYYFAVVVRDLAGNKTIFTPVSQTTPAQ